MLETSKNKLEKLYDIFKTADRVLIIISADPDAIASAMALKRLLWRKVKSVTITSLNEVTKIDNLNLLAYIGIKLIPFKDIDLLQYNKLTMVDSQPHHNSKTIDLNFDLIIDHHPLIENNQDLQKRYDHNFFDVRPEYGAVGTIMTEYLKRAKIKPNPKLATALFYAIKTDTQNFIRQGQENDMYAFHWLYPLINPNTLQAISKKHLSQFSFKYFQKGINDVIFNDKKAFLFLKNVDSPDTLVSLADFLLTLEEIDIVIVSGIFKKKLVVIFRNANNNLHAGKIAENIFAAYGSAGGHKVMARAEVYLENIYKKLSIDKSQEKTINIEFFLKDLLKKWAEEKQKAE